MFRGSAAARNRARREDAETALPERDPADAYQVKLRLFSTGGAVPSVRFASVALSGAAPARATLEPGDPANWGTLVDLPIG